MKKLNVKLLLILIFGALATAVGIHFLHGYQVARSSKNLLVRAEKAENSGNREEVVRLLGRYLVHNPKDLEQWKRLIRVWKDHLLTGDKISTRQFHQLYGALEKVIRETPNDIELRREGADFALRVGLVVNAISHLQEIEAAGQLTPTDMIMLAQCYAHNGDDDKAIELLSQLTGFNPASEQFDRKEATAPKEIEAYKWLSSIYRLRKSSNNELRVPDLIINQMVQANPESYRAHLIRAQHYQAFHKADPGGPDQVQQDIHRALELAPDEIQVLLMGSGFAMQQEDYAQAQELLDRAVRLYPGDFRIYLQLAELARRQQNTEQSLAHIDKGLDALPLNGELLYARAELELVTNQLEACKTTLERLIPQNFDRHRIRLLQARIYMAEGNHRKGAEELEKLLPLVAEQESLHERALRFLYECYTALGQDDRASEIAKRLPQSNFTVTLRQAEAAMSNGDLQEALKLYQELLQQPDLLTPEGRDLVMRRILDVRVQQQRRQPPNERDWSQTDRMAQQFRDRPDLNDAQREEFWISYLIQKGEVAEARSRAEQAVLRFPTHMSFYITLERLTNDHQQAMKILDMLQRQVGDQVVIRLAKANRLVQAANPDMLDQLAELQAGAETFSDAEQRRLWQGLAQTYTRIQQHDEAIALWKRTLQGNLKDTGVIFQIFDLATQANDSATIQEMQTKLEAIAGRTSSEWQLLEAKRMMWQFEAGERGKEALSDARQLIEQVRSARPNLAAVDELHGDLAFLQGDVAGAARALQESLEKRPGNPSVLQKLYKIFMKAGMVPQAHSLLLQVPEQLWTREDQFNEIRMLLVSDPEAALEKTRRFISPRSTDPQDWSTLAEIYQAAKQPAQAVAAVEKALTLAPNDPQLYSRLVQLHVLQNDTAAARAVLPKMQANVPPGFPLSLALGQAHAMLGEYSEANTAYEAALQQRPGDVVTLRNLVQLHLGTGDSATAQVYLEQILQQDATSNDPTVAENIIWARRRKAELLEQTQVYENFLQALQLLEANGGEGGMVGEDLLLWLRFCERRPESQSWQRAIQRLEHLQQDRRLTHSELAILASLYKKRGDWTQAENLMLQLLSEQSTPTTLTVYIDWLLERNNLTSAVAWIRKLPEGSIQRIRFQSILLVRQDKSPAAARNLLKLVPADLPQAEAGKLVGVAQIMEELAQYNKAFYKLAERQLRRYVNLQPEHVGVLAEYLVRIPFEAQDQPGEKLEEAFKICESQMSQAAQSDDAASLARFLYVGVTGLRMHKAELPADSKLYDRVAQWLQAARSRYPDSYTLMSIEFEYADLRGDTQKLESLYRAALARQDVPALERGRIQNNLAFTLAVSNRGQEALQVIDQAIDSLGPRADLLDTRAMAYIAAGQYPEAIKELRSIQNDGGMTAQMYFHLALAEHKNGNTTAAADAMTQALKLGLKESDLAEAESKMYRSLMQEIRPSMQQLSSSP